jgi:hypothetical protein
MDTIYIPFIQFKEALAGNVPSMTPLFKAIEELKSRFPCLTAPITSHEGGPFRSHGGEGGTWGNDGRNGGGHHHHRRKGYHHHHHKKAERPRIGVREFSREDISRKDFTANLNKLSRQNYEAILRLIRITYNSNFLSNYMEILWTMMVRQPDFQDLHIQVIHHLLSITPPERKVQAQAYWTERFQTYFQSRPWLPPSSEFLQATSEEYDTFCDYLKWKKNTGAGLVAWLRLMESDIIPADFQRCFTTVASHIEEAFSQHSFKFAECLLEWMFQMVSAVPSGIPEDLHFQLNDWLGLIKYHGLSSALRFKIMDIQEHLEKN